MPNFFPTHSGTARPPVSRRVPLSRTTDPSGSCKDQTFTGVRRGWREKRSVRPPATPISTVAVLAPARTRLSRASP